MKTIISNIEDVLDVLTEEQQNKLSLLKEFRVKGLYRYCISTGRYSEEIITYEDFKTIFFVPYGDKYLFRYSNTFCITEILDRFYTLYRQVKCQCNNVAELKKTCEKICYDVESKNGVYWSSSHL